MERRILISNYILNVIIKIQDFIFIFKLAIFNFINFDTLRLI